MLRVQALLRCIGAGLCEKGRRALTNDTPYGEVLFEVARASLDHARKELPSDDLRHALAEAAAADPAEYADDLTATLNGVLRIQGGPYKAALETYLGALPTAIRQVLRRPSDPAGKSAPHKLAFYKPDDLLVFLPPRPPRFHPAGEPAGLDNWELAELAGCGESSEVWFAADDARLKESPAAMKFATDPQMAAAVIARQEIFLKVFDLNAEAGIVPLRSVYLETDPPCLESMCIPGYDLAALMHDWKWTTDGPKPEAALKLVKRLAQIVAKAHKKGVVHRDLKPTNVLLRPTDGGKFTLWVTDFGWGQLQAARAADPTRGLKMPRGEQVRLSLRGAFTPLYLAPQIAKKEEPDPRDDVYSLGVMWYQLLKRDPSAPPPVGTDWTAEFEKAGLTDSQAHLLAACLSHRAEKRPADAAELAEKMDQAKIADRLPAVPEGSKLISIKSQSGIYKPPEKSGKLKAGGPSSGVMASPPSGKMSGPASSRYIQLDPQELGYGYGGLPRLVYNSVGMPLALIPPGEFQMGSADGESGRREHEGPQRTVTITQPFYLGVLPVTQIQYVRVMGSNPAQFTKAHGGGTDNPVEMVSWFDAEQFCFKLSQMPEEQTRQRTYRLPTEAEWEYACRGGTTTPFSFGERLTPKEAHYASPEAFGRTGGQGRTCTAGKFPANPFGLHDVHGNVLEWVHDWYDAFYYHDGPAADPPGPEKGKLKVARGGCWSMFANDCRSAARRGQEPDTLSNTTGFRIAFTPAGKIKA